MNPTLHMWSGVLWRIKNNKIAYAHCPEHQGTVMDVKNESGWTVGQDELNKIIPKTIFVCPVDNVEFSLLQDYFTLQRRVIAITRSSDYREAKIVDLDNIYTPILRVSPKPKDDRYSIQVEIDSTSNGKKLVIYAADREENGKTQIFIDPQVDKLTFDSKNDLHPNTIFTRIDAYFKDGRKVSLEELEQ